MYHVTKAVFPVAGLGTRFLPATKAMPKELLPIIDTPIIQLAVEEAIGAGITELVFVTGRTKRAIEDHFDRNPELEAALQAKGKGDLYDMVRAIVPDGVNCIFVRQPEALGLGHAVLCAAPVIGEAPFVVLLADDVMVGDPLPTASLMAAYAKTGRSVISVAQVPAHSVSDYGIISTTGSECGGLLVVSGIIEKPRPDRAPSNFASIGRYVFGAEIFAILRRQPAGYGGEIQLSDAINTLAISAGVDAHCFAGRRYDCGSKFGYLEAIVDAALAHPDYGDQFFELLRQRVGARAAAE